MSHVTTAELKIKDVEAAEAAAKELGGGLFRNVDRFNWYGQHVGDYPIPPGLKQATMGQCDHVIRFPGIRYEVGLVKQKDGTFLLAYDFYGSGGQHDGQALQRKIGQNAKKLSQLYAVHAAARAARAKGWSVVRSAGANNAIRLQILSH